nr:helix-turn-helix transcriptional regulator [Thermoleptolyngbya sichuanensis]
MPVLQHIGADEGQIAHDARLSQQQLLQVLDYLNDHLDQEIKLANLSNLLGTSQFHFSRLFRQSVGLSPYQYLL